ncbi:DNA-binding protein [Lachnoclostridium phytofermentans]|uniref:Putative phage-related DNA binding protein n=1 Tax=Lachnoclostridium phytofermentans (strain ATCC 700394 / DSM 18823 / ISDg) TaxID=357809 RepID=A9KQ38_LACP7|nr:DNA-binding protein [Lachnoclostridium phytofermentans]ABX43350.1 putative phage-related DNA binding protein [Lachnoclostridium phytofermentans ISDg]
MLYANLLNAMKSKGITSTQLANLLECRQATMSDKLNGVVNCGFYFDEAYKIKKVFFPEYDYDYLFIREKLVS